MLGVLLACFFVVQCNRTFADYEPLSHNPIGLEQLAFFDAHGSVVLLVNPDDGSIVYANTAAEALYGYTKAALTEMNISEINTLSKPQIKAEMEKAVQESRNYFEFIHRKADGTPISVEVYSYPIQMTSGEQLLFSIVHDVTEKKLASERATKGVQLVVGLLSAFAVAAFVFSGVLYAQKRLLAVKNRHVRLMVENMQEGFALFEIVGSLQAAKAGKTEKLDYILREVNSAFCTMIRSDREQLLGRYADQILPGYNDHWKHLFDQVAHSGEAMVLTDLSLALDCHQHITLYQPESHTVALMATDTTTFARLSQSMEQERHFFHRLLNALGQGVVAVNDSDEIVMLNDHAATILQIEAQQVIGRNYKEIFSFERKLEPIFLDPLGLLPQQVHYDLELRCLDGRLIPMELNISPLNDRQGTWMGTVFTFRDYSIMRTKEEEILFLSYHDQLTGVYNRHYFEEAIRRMDNPWYLPLSLVMIDVNGLKMTNDAFGHEMGDLLLKTVATHLKAVCRAEDIVARVGGDEFVLLLPRTNSQQLQRITRALRLGELGVEPQNIMTGEGVRILLISYAVGAVTKQTQDESISFLIRLAENRMYQNKLEEDLVTRKHMIEIILRQLYEFQEQEETHAKRVSHLMAIWGKKMALEQQLVDELALLGLVHDIGKISLTKAVLQKTGSLSSEDWAAVKRHCECGYHILRSVEGYGAIAEAVLNHHERWDGTGYPRALEGNSCHWMSRILAIADAYEAMTGSRAYRTSRSVVAALAELERCSGTQFDPELVTRFLECFTLAELEAI